MIKPCMEVKLKEINIMQKKLDTKLDLTEANKILGLDGGQSSSVISPPEMVPSPKVGSPRRKERRGPWEII